MEHAVVVFPDVDVVLAHAEQYGYVLGLDYMTLTEHGVLGDALYYLRNVVTQYHPDRVFSFYELH